MGCDIHMFIEGKLKGEDEWTLINQPDVDRWYSLFGKLAGVRGSQEPIVEPKGFPTDASKATRAVYEYWGPDAHTPSFLTWEEIIEVRNYFRDNHAREDFNYWEVFGWDEPATEDEDQPFSDIRAVFWFDN